MKRYKGHTSLATNIVNHHPQSHVSMQRSFLFHATASYHHNFIRSSLHYYISYIVLARKARSTCLLTKYQNRCCAGMPNGINGPRRLPRQNRPHAPRLRCRGGGRAGRRELQPRQSTYDVALLSQIISSASGWSRQQPEEAKEAVAYVHQTCPTSWWS